MLWINQLICTTVHMYTHTHTHSHSHTHTNTPHAPYTHTRTQPPPPPPPPPHTHTDRRFNRYRVPVGVFYYAISPSLHSKPSILPSLAPSSATFKTHFPERSDCYLMPIGIQRCQPSRFRRILLRRMTYSTVLRQLNICYGFKRQTPDIYF